MWIGVFIRMLIGGLAGAVTMLLLAPQSGQQTRAKLRRQSHELREQMVDSMEDAMLTGPVALAPQPAGVQHDAEGNVIGGAFAESIETPGLDVQELGAETDQPVTLTLLGTMHGIRPADILSGAPRG